MGRKTGSVANYKNDEVVGRRSGAPFVLGANTNNLHINSEREDDLKNGFITLAEIKEQFKEMRKKMNGSRGMLMENKETGEHKTFSSMSRWNDEYNYSSLVRRRFEMEFEGLKEIKMIVLTVDRDVLRGVVPDWWTGTDAEYMVVYGSLYVNRFLKRLRQYREKKGQRWNFICWVMEFHSDGVAHYHVMFRGGYIAPFEVMDAMWGLGKVRYKAKDKSQDGKSGLFYLTQYITKDLKHLMKKGHENLGALMWYFKKRFYNVRRVGNRKDVAEVLQGGGKRVWNRYVRDGEYRGIIELGKLYGLNTMQKIEHYVYGIKLKRTFHDENTNKNKLLELRAMLEERLRQDGWCKCAE